MYYKLNGFNYPSLKHVFVASLPKEIQPELQRQFTIHQLDIANLSLGKIYQLAINCLERLCEQKEFFKDPIENKQPFKSACKKPHFAIKCKSKKDCTCSTKKKSHFQKFRNSEKKSHTPSRTKKSYQFFRKKNPDQSFKSKSSRCFICKKKGHFTKNCPNRPTKSVRLIEHLQDSMLLSESDDVESFFSEQEDYDEQTAFFLAEKDNHSEAEHVSVIKTVQQIQKVQPVIPIPSIKILILSGRFDKPVPIIGFVDTRAQKSMLNPSIIPSHFWEKHTEYFKAANGELFHTNLITKKPVGIQFFPRCVLWTKLVGSNLPDKDLLIGFDVLHLVKRLHITASGIRYKQMFQPYIDSLKLFSVTSSPPSYNPLKSRFFLHCSENHSQFHHPTPLSKNENFFIKLPFKLNEDINPTKATHPGMTPTDLKLAQEECSQLLKQDLIELANSKWVCQAFYVEKMFEIVIGKKRLVIDYQPLNCFLKDDKFPLPKIQSLFVHIQNAKVFSKFDLKASFWQLGIHPDDRPKTAFCIPNAHYQWKVMSFDFKVAPSLFQKAMIKIFEPIIHHALVYIDDVLSFSKDHDSHQ
ncbi:uncharacterized protein LOC107178762 [Citrus sinensis]|uniref:uncharacterized protein LOC107178762 n=1 Tax=Citrus sinensis TaxID=2711 RepID=UPI000763A325|nr:uncharacterized protein LOC107178762 [Citrus sinensis]XP_024046583.1 uncharacterized protein LOC112100935 [Citrus x clementina]